MNDDSPEKEGVQTLAQGRQSLPGLAKVLLGVCFVFLLLCCGFPFTNLLIVGLVDLSVGWLAYGYTTFPKTTIHWSDVFFTLGLLCVICLVINYFGRFFVSHSVEKTDETKWRFRSAVTLTLLVVVLFGSGISIVAMAHQCIWMFTSKEPIIGSTAGHVAYRTFTRNRMKNLALGVSNFENMKNHFPSGAIVDTANVMTHSWMTQILPEIEQQELFKKIQWDEPWNSQANQEFFKTEVEEFMNPILRKDSECRSLEGYGYSHFAANERMLPVGQFLRMSDVMNDGTSQTILLGEVAENYQPWGSPRNLRDPAIGINRSSYSFGSHWGDGVHFGLADGSVQWVSDDIHHDVLKALSTPNGGEEEHYDF